MNLDMLQYYIELTFASNCSISTDMVSNILSCVELLSSGVVSDLQEQKHPKEKYYGNIHTPNRIIVIVWITNSRFSSTSIPGAAVAGAQFTEGDQFQVKFIFQLSRLLSQICNILCMQICTYI